MNNFLYRINGNVIFLKNIEDEYAYILKEIIECNRPDLSDEDRDLLYSEIINTMENFVGYQPKNVYPKVNKAIYLDRRNINHDRRLCSMDYYLINGAFPLIKFEEVKGEINGLLKHPVIKALLSTIGSLIAFLLGGFDTLVWIMILAGIISVIAGIEDKSDIYVTLPQKMVIRIRYFLYPFIFLALLNLVLYGLMIGVPILSNTQFLFIRNFIITWFIIRYLEKYVEKLKEVGYDLPEPIYKLFNAIRNAADSAKSSFLDSLKK